MQAFYKNIYTQYIGYLKTEEKKTKDKNLDLEKHHIIPLHDGGKKDGEIVLYPDSIHLPLSLLSFGSKGHYYRYLAYSQKGDMVAFSMRWNQKLGLNQRALLAIEQNKKRKNLFWDPNWQRKQGKKGGKKGGLIV